MEQIEPSLEADTERILGEHQKSVLRSLSEETTGSPVQLVSFLLGWFFTTVEEKRLFSAELEYFATLALYADRNAGSPTCSDLAKLVDQLFPTCMLLVQLARTRVRTLPDPASRPSIEDIVAPSLRSFQTTRWILPDQELDRELVGLSGHDPGALWNAPLLLGPNAHPGTAGPDATVTEFDFEINELCGALPRLLGIFSHMLLEHLTASAQEPEFKKKVRAAGLSTNTSDFFLDLSFDVETLKSYAKSRGGPAFDLLESAFDDRIGPFLKKFSVDVEDPIWQKRPKPAVDILTNGPLRDRPLLHQDGRYLLVQPLELPHAILRRVHERIDQEDELGIRWKKIRSEWLEQEVVMLLKHGLSVNDNEPAGEEPNCWTNIEWSEPQLVRKRDGSQVAGEIDVLVERFGLSVLAECKSGRPKFKSKANVERSIDRLFHRPSEQLGRIRSIANLVPTRGVIFYKENRQLSTAEQKKVLNALSTTVQIDLIVTLEDLGTASPFLAGLLERSRQRPHRPPIVISLNDLRRVSSRLKGAHFINYLHQRCQYFPVLGGNESFGDLAEDSLIDRHSHFGLISKKLNWELQLKGERPIEPGHAPKLDQTEKERTPVTDLLDMLNRELPVQMAAAACGLNTLQEQESEETEKLLGLLASNKWTGQGLLSLSGNKAAGLAIYITVHKGIGTNTVVEMALEQAQSSNYQLPIALIVVILPSPGSRRGIEIVSSGALQEALMPRLAINAGWREPLADLIDVHTGRPPAGTVFHRSKKQPRNELCGCGSGKKYKKCCIDLR